jgi:hypothetical protein
MPSKFASKPAPDIEPYRPETVRDSFVMPADEHLQIAKIIGKMRKITTRDPTKNEIIRIAIFLANKLDGEVLAEHFKQLKKVTKGRPRKF